MVEFPHFKRIIFKNSILTKINLNNKNINPQINLTNGGAKQTAAQPRAPARGNKASNLSLKAPLGVGAAAGETPSLTGEVVGETHRA